MILMRIVDIIYSVPTLLYVILIMLIFGSNMFSVLLAICISSWVGLARQVRAQVMSQKEQEYALAAKVLGASDMRILFRHLVKNSIGPIIVNTTLMVPSAIFTEAFLSFVGIGISIPMASWGTMANEAKNMLFSAPLQMVWPVSAICLTMLALNFIGDGLNQALDPKKRSR
jgi:oligopeptide transport system permease protein